MVSDLLSGDRIVGELVGEFDRLTLEMRDVPSVTAAVKTSRSRSRNWSVSASHGWASSGPTR